MLQSIYNSDPVSLGNSNADDITSTILKRAGIKGNSRDFSAYSKTNVSDAANPETPEKTISGGAITSSAINVLGAISMTENGSPLESAGARTGRTVNLMATGAEAGMMFGPIGGAIGAVAGGLYGNFKADSDKKKIVEMKNKKLVAGLAKVASERENQQRMDEGLQQIDAAKNVYKAQLGIIG